MGKKFLIGCSLVSCGIAASLLLNPMEAKASNCVSDYKTAGVASLFNFNYTVEEFIKIAEDAKGAHFGYTNIGVATVEEGNLNVRALPSMDGKLVGKMRNHSACEILDTVNGWAHIMSGEVEGYVSLDYLATGADGVIEAQKYVRTVAVAKVDNLNVRLEPNTESAVYTQMLKDTDLEYIETQGEWVKVMVDDVEAYVSAEFVEVKDMLETAITMSELLYGEGISDVRVDLVEYAKQFLGNPYVWGGTSLTKGCDCSGFVLSIYKKFGIDLPHYSGSQAGYGTKISFSEIQPGDLIFYADSKGVIGHVAIYIGNNQIIHAASKNTGIIISKYNYRTPYKYVRLLIE